MILNLHTIATSTGIFNTNRGKLGYIDKLVSGLFTNGEILQDKKCTFSLNNTGNVL